MTKLHAAAGGRLTRELLADALAEFDVWAANAPSQAVSIAQGDPEQAARFALMDVRAEIMDHLQIRLALTLATYGISPEGET